MDSKQILKKLSEHGKQSTGSPETRAHLLYRCDCGLRTLGKECWKDGNVISFLTAKEKEKGLVASCSNLGLEVKSTVPRTLSPACYISIKVLQNLTLYPNT